MPNYFIFPAYIPEVINDLIIILCGIPVQAAGVTEEGGI